MLNGAAGGYNHYCTPGVPGSILIAPNKNVINNDLYPTTAEINTFFSSVGISENNCDTIPILKAKFSGTPVEIHPSETVTFTDESTQTNNPITSWEWTFEGGNPSTFNGQNPPAITYENEGIYNVKLKISDGLGNDEKIKENYILVSNYCFASAINDLLYTNNYISKVELSNINRTSEGTIYSNFTSDTATIDHYMKTATITIANSHPSNKLYAWIDWNKDGDFDDANEQVCNKIASSFSPVTFDVVTPTSFTLADKGTTRMRIRLNDTIENVNYNNISNETACGESSYGEVEDYTINIDIIIKAEFSANITEIHPNETVIFTDETIQGDNTITSWHWTFEGGNPSTFNGQNPPAITYENKGVYNVKLIVEDGSNTDEILKNDYIFVDTYCIATATNADTNYGYISKVELENINRYSSGIDINYSNYTSDTASIGHHSKIATITIDNPHSSNKLYAWIDWNKDNDFDDANEQVCNKNADTSTVTFDVTIPDFLTTNDNGSTRMRIRLNDTTENGNYTNISNETACGESSYGEVEDYTINIDIKLKADFIANNTENYINDTVIFTDKSELGDNPITSWHWTFEGGNPSTFNGQNPPAIIYENGGDLDVKLVISDGLDTTVELKNDYIYIEKYCLASAVNTESQKEYISSFQLGNINRISEETDYSNFTSDTATINHYVKTARVTIANPNSSDKLYAWIDWNKDGDFDDANEQVCNKIASSSLVYFDVTTPTSLTLADKGPTRMRIRLNDTIENGNYNNISNETACGESSYGEVEDYTINIDIIIKAEFSANITNIQRNETIIFSDESTLGDSPIISWNWTFYGGNPSTFNGQNPPAITYENEGMYYVSLNIEDSSYTDENFKYNYIFVDTYCIATATNADTNHGYISKVELENINRYSSSAIDIDYSNYTTDTASIGHHSKIATVTIDNPHSSNKLYAWIDWNKDNDFDDANEQVCNKNANTSTVTFDVAVPSFLTTDDNGPTRMRIRLNDTTENGNYTNISNETACGESSYGEVEDYTINIDIKLKADFIANHTDVIPSETVMFTDESGQVNNSITFWEWTFEGGNPSTFNGQNPPAITYENEGTYDVKLVISDGLDTTTELKNDYIYVDKYCSASAITTTSTILNCEYISNVETENINNYSQDNSYSYFTSVIANLINHIGSSETVTVFIDNLYEGDKLYAWVDWNYDGDFDDANEQIYNEKADFIVTFDITVPSSVNVCCCLTRMRIRLNDTTETVNYTNISNETPCGVSTYGEVEDYIINIEPMVNINNISNNTFTIYPNPNNGVFNIVTTNNASNKITITDISGKLVYENNTNTNNILVDLNNVNKGIYFVKIFNEAGVKIEKIIIK